MLDCDLELTLEQEFTLKLYEDQVKSLSPEEAQEVLLVILHHLMLKDNVIKCLCRQHLGLGND